MINIEAWGRGSGGGPVTARGLWRTGSRRVNGGKGRGLQRAARLAPHQPGVNRGCEGGDAPQPPGVEAGQPKRRNPRISACSLKSIVRGFNIAEQTGSAQPPEPAAAGFRPTLLRRLLSSPSPPTPAHTTTHPYMHTSAYCPLPPHRMFSHPPL
eukprot:scaffold2600_cov103-Isochrysis_galbana.AAC.10